MEPLVSVIIPAWNAATFLPRALDAALEQRGIQVEVLVVDDGSTDDTRAVACARAAADPRLKVLTHEMSRGPSAARNTALKQARGEWVALLDADDAQHSDRLERMVRIAVDRRLDALADNLMLIDGASGANLGVALSPEFVGLDGPLTLETFLSHDWPGRNLPYLGSGTSKPIFRRGFIEEVALRYETDVRLGEDMLLYATALLRGANFGVTPEPLYFYTVRSGSESRRRRPTLELVDVNARITRAAIVQGASPERLDLLERREQALRFQVLTWALKQGRAGLVLQLARQLGPSSFARLVGETLRRRVGAHRQVKRLKDGSGDLLPGDLDGASAGEPERA